jgi:hypothetical protein
MNITTETIFWTQVASIIAYVVALFVVYRVLVEQKDATIQLKQEHIAYLKEQLVEAKSQSPDVLAQKLTSRMTLYEEEFRRLEQDNSSTQDQFKANEAELKQALLEAEELTKKMNDARKLLGGFFCPDCGLGLLESSCRSVSGVNHEYKEFLCGYKIVNGAVVGDCIV